MLCNRCYAEMPISVKSDYTIYDWTRYWIWEDSMPIRLISANFQEIWFCPTCSDKHRFDFEKSNPNQKASCNYCHAVVPYCKPIEGWISISVEKYIPKKGIYFEYTILDPMRKGWFCHSHR